MIKRLFFLVLTFAIIIFIINIQNAVFYLCLFMTGISGIWLFDRNDRHYSILIFSTLYLVGGIYALACYVYMNIHNYDHLLAYDTFNYFLPRTEYYLGYPDYYSAFKEIWESYDFFTRGHAGYFTYTTFFGFLAKKFNLALYFTLQFSSLLLFSFSGPIVFKLFKINNFDLRKAYKHTITIFIFSILFFYSAQLLRDVHIMLTYLWAIYITFEKEFSIISLIKLIIIVLISCTLRIESGLFLFLLIPIYLLLTIQQSGKRLKPVLFTFIILLVFILFIARYIISIEYLFASNQSAYVENISEGTGVIGTLQKVPVIGDIASIIYNAVQPVPAWSKFEVRDGRPESYNVMTFPFISASLFNVFVIVNIFFYLFSSNLRNHIRNTISKPFKYQLWIGFLFLFIQSAVISQRRLMAYYVVYYIFSFIIFDGLIKKEKQWILFVTAVCFVILQVIGLYFNL